MSDAAAAAAATIGERAGGAAPRLAMVLGTGLGSVAEALSDRTVIPYRDLPGFPAATLEGHAGELVLGRLGRLPVAALKGRAHYYEDGRADVMDGPLLALRAAGAESLVLTNAAGSLRPEAGPGSLVMITDHINFSGTNPLIGRAQNLRFVDMTDAYDPALRQVLAEVAERRNITLHQGVYMWFSGPTFETPAEIRAAGLLGADLVGMSVVPETILARRCGLRVAAVSVVTNPAAGMGKEALSHAASMAEAKGAVAALTELLTGFAERLAA